MIFLVGREYMLPVSTICLGHGIVRGERVEILIINPGIPKRGVNDNVPPHSKP